MDNPMMTLRYRLLRMIPIAIFFIGISSLILRYAFFETVQKDDTTKVWLWVNPRPKPIPLADAVKNGTVAFDVDYSGTDNPAACSFINKTSRPISIDLPQNGSLNLAHKAQQSVQTLNPGIFVQEANVLNRLPAVDDGRLFWMPVIFSTLLMLAALFVILAKFYGPTEKHWAYGTLGTIIGYWLKG